jgi:hypothetical protein
MAAAEKIWMQITPLKKEKAGVVSRVNDVKLERDSRLVEEKQ